MGTEVDLGINVIKVVLWLVLFANLYCTVNLLLYNLIGGTDEDTDRAQQIAILLPVLYWGYRFTKWLNTKIDKA